MAIRVGSRSEPVVQTSVSAPSQIVRELDLYAGATPIQASADADVLPLSGDGPSALKAQVRILLVEDDEKLANAVRTGIEMRGGNVVRTGTAEDALRLLLRRSFDIVLLDVVLPGRSGLQLLQLIRANRIDTPVLMLSGRDAIGDRVLGLESGADDYLVKPFAFPELLARIRVLVRRHKPDQAKYLKCADLEIDLKAHTAMRAGIPLILTLREFEILQYLCHNQGCVVSRETLARDIWKETRRYTPLDNVINVHVSRLRQKVDGNSSHKLLHTLRRVGFILRGQAE